MVATPTPEPRTPSLSSRPPLSGSIICRDEAQHIRSCLESLTFCDEVVVVDSGSTDGTVEIARQFPNVRLIERPFIDYVTQRNLALDLCRNDWILALDGDEALTPQLQAEIQSLDFDVEGYRLRRHNFIGSRRMRFGAWNPDWLVRLFRRSRGRFAGDNPHYTVRLDGRTRSLRHPFLHWSYASLEEYAVRTRHYATLVARARRERGESASPWDPWIHGLASFAKAYLLRLGALDGAAGWQLAWHGARASALKYRLMRPSGPGPR